MKIADQTVYAYRVFTHSHAFKVLAPFSTIDALWEEIEKNSILDVQYPDNSGVIISLSVRCNTIEAIDNPYGTEPVSKMEGPAPTENVTNRASVRGGKIVLGQQAKKLGKRQK